MQVEIRNISRVLVRHWKALCKSRLMTMRRWIKLSPTKPQPFSLSRFKVKAGFGRSLNLVFQSFASFVMSAEHC